MAGEGRFVIQQACEIWRKKAGEMPGSEAASCLILV